MRPPAVAEGDGLEEGLGTAKRHPLQQAGGLWNLRYKMKCLARPVLFLRLPAVVEGDG
ncbi:hypothetical protein [Legionella longbeachae]|uniref:hypothetical protein n=1 Tax=Legionella longbeachae TaxID=450 RepID=UPI0002FB9D9D|nr:hypothetical protein [Legionella longbeachae]HBD7399197.1 hypothetical protein [Legionella pneumophila]